MVGTLFDINQNYFSRRLPDGREVQVQRFNYHASMFAANGYSENTEKYALAHQVFLIDYSHVAAMRPVIDALLALDLEDFGELARGRRRHNLTEIRNGFRALLEGQEIAQTAGIFSDRGIERVRDQLLPRVRELRGSYYGMIEGIYPVHLISRRPIPLRFIREQLDIPCEIRVSDDDHTWAFEPSGIGEDSPDFFHLEFTIPEFIADMLNTRTGPERERIPHWEQLADVKRRYMRFIDVTAVLDGQLLGFRLTLDVDWLNRYVQRRQALAPRRRARGEPRG